MLEMTGQRKDNKDNLVPCHKLLKFIQNMTSFHHYLQHIVFKFININRLLYLLMFHNSGHF